MGLNYCADRVQIWAFRYIFMENHAFLIPEAIVESNLLQLAVTIKLLYLLKKRTFNTLSNLFNINAVYKKCQDILRIICRIICEYYPLY